jgi:beta-glucosidase
VAPWGLYVGDTANWKIAAGASAETTGPAALRLQPADRARQGDARSVRFAGGGAAQVYLQGESPVDLSRESNGDLALAFDVLVDEPPSGEVTLRMDCGYPCSGALDVTEPLRALPAGEWSTLRFRLRCFADAGADMTRIDTPFLIATDGSLALRFADVKLVSAAAGEASCP